MHIPQHWRLNAQRYQLRGNQHPDGSISFPPRPDVSERHPERYDLGGQDCEQPAVEPKTMASVA